MRGNVVTLQDFDGYYTDKAGQIPENGFVELFNCEVTNKGTLKARRGVQHFSTVTKTDASIIGRWRTTGGSDYLVVKTSTGVSFVDTATMLIDLALASPADLALQWDNKAYIFSTSANLTTYDGAAVVTAVTYRGTVGVVHKTRMFIVDNTVNTVARSQLRYSDLFALNAPNTVGGWPANNFGDFQSSDGDFITAVAVLNDALIVFKRYSTWAYYVEGSPPWTIRQLHPTIGCVGRDSVVVIGGLLYFVSAQGVYRTDGTTFELITGGVDDAWDNISSATATLTNATSAVEYDGKYIVNVNNNTVLDVYNIDKGAWSQWVLPSAVSRLYGLPDTTPWSIRTWYYGTTQKPAEYNNLTDYVDKDSTVFDMTVTTKHANFDKPELYKRVREVSFDLSVDSGSPNVSGEVTYVKDGSLAVAPGSRTISNDARRIFLRFIGPGMCRVLQTSFEHRVLTDVEINSISFDISTRERVGRAH